MHGMIVLLILLIVFIINVSEGKDGFESLCKSILLMTTIMYILIEVLSIFNKLTVEHLR